MNYIPNIRIFMVVMKALTTKRLFAVLLFFCTSFCKGQTLAEKIDSIVHLYDIRGGYNGIIVAGFGADSILTLEYGYKDPEAKKERISLTDRFDLASLAKQFTGFAVLQLIDKGVIQPEETIGKYLPELKPALQKVTIRQLANHTNGIHDFYSLTTRHDTLDKQEALYLISKLDTTVFAPGSRWGYSNSGYLLLSEIVERVTKMTFREYCLKNIFTPLGMVSACQLPACNEKLKGYTNDLKPVVFNAFSSGEAGMYASGQDMIAYYQTVCRNRAQWQKYFTRSYEFSEASNTENWNYGFGWYFTEDQLGKFRAHSGRNTGADTYVRWYDDSNLFICLLANKRMEYFKELRESISTLIVSEFQ